MAYAAWVRSSESKLYWIDRMQLTWFGQFAEMNPPLTDEHVSEKNK
jgi:hypothetical protein